MSSGELDAKSNRAAAQTFSSSSKLSLVLASSEKIAYATKKRLKCVMNGTARNIEILAPFNQAIELTRLILFRPFDITKWLVIGFAAFLSGWFSSGGGSINPWSFRGWNTSNAQPPAFQFRSFNIDHAGVLFLVLIAVLVMIFFAFLILWLWITARGRFIFIDCIVQNRAAIAEPWREFRREGNRFFLFLIVLMFASIAIAVLLAGLVFGFVMLWRNYHISNTPALIVLVPIAVFAWVAFAVVVNLIVYFIPPVMYARRCSPGEAGRGLLQLVLDEPAPFILFILFMIALWIGWIMVGCLVTCLTCCLASLPYIGTVIVLPVPVFFRSFSLLFLRQFGSDWDVWGKVPVPATTTPPPVQTIVPASPITPTQETTLPAPPSPPDSPERSPYGPPPSPPPQI